MEREDGGRGREKGRELGGRDKQRGRGGEGRKEVKECIYVDNFFSSSGS